VVVVAGTRVDLGFHRFQKLSADYAAIWDAGRLGFPTAFQKGASFSSAIRSNLSVAPQLRRSRE